MQKYILIISLMVTLLQASESDIYFPKWMLDSATHPSDQCAVGYGRASSSDPAKEALYSAKVELGLLQEVLVKSSIKIFEKYNKDNFINSVYTMVTKQSGKSIAKGVSRVEQWATPSGDVFSLVCVDENKKKNVAVSSSIELFERATRFGDNEEYSYQGKIDIGKFTLFEFTSEDIKKSTTQKKKIVVKKIKKDDYRCRSARVLAPEWVCSPHVEGSYADLGISVIEGDRVAQAYLKAVISARVGLSQMITGVKKHAAGINPVSKSAKSNAIKSVSHDTLKQSKVLKLWYNKVNSTIYLLMATPEDTINESIK
ncbi:MAG: hypothetical protein JJW00_10060 [Sulfurimonas sp.]|nr:hypothetical protein [Sulfurimonas sp.]